MKKKLIILVIILSLLSMIVLFKKENDTQIYTSEIRDIADFGDISENRYLLLYNSSNDTSYLATVKPYGIEDILYELGKGIYNFGPNNDKQSMTIISEDKKIVLKDGKCNKTSDDSFKIHADLLMISYDLKNHNMSILKRNSEVNCILEFKYYADYTPIDLIQVNE